jgi:hypothetical protein
MKRLLQVLCVGLVAFLSAVTPAVAGSGAGAIVLVFPVGARYNALGEAGLALAQDATAAWYSPGGMAFMVDRYPVVNDVQLMYSKLAAGLADDIALTWAGYAGPLGGGIFGLSFTYLDMGEQQATDEEGTVTGTFSSYEFVIQGNYAFKLSPNVGFGFGVKYFRDKLAPDDVLKDRTGGSGDSFGFDAGVLWKIPAAQLNLAAAVHNVGPRIKHVDADQADPMPRKFTVGFAKNLHQGEFMGALLVGDYQLPLYKWKRDDYVFGLENAQGEWGVGIEGSYDRSLYLRFGYKSADYGDINDFTFGFGVDLLKWTERAIIFDFAAVPQAEGLDRVSRFTVGYRW